MSDPAATRTARDETLIWRTKERANTTKIRIPAGQLDKTVEAVTLHAARAQMEDKKTGVESEVAHFRLYLQLQGGQSSVMLNSTGEGVAP